MVGKNVINLFVIIAFCWQPMLTQRTFLSFIDPVSVAHNEINAKAKIVDTTASEPQYHWKENWFEGMPIDHFSYRNNQNFRLRYLINVDNYKTGGPLFFYAGNEGGIEGFAKNTGIMWDLAPQFNAAIVFAEHRFYGKTMPFGNDSYKNVSKLGYLDSIQALADYAKLIPSIKKQINSSASTAVIAFGGSYGGMLAAWLRMKYPHIVAGAWASSAPLRYFEGCDVPPTTFDNITTETFVSSGCSRAAIANGFVALQNLSQTVAGLNYLNNLFKLKTPMTSKDFDQLYNYINSAIVYMAMCDYPYPSNFLKNMPAWPVQYACQFAAMAPNYDEQLANQMYQIANVYYNYTGDLDYNCITDDCAGGSTSALGSPDGWPWQSCTEIVFMMCDGGGDTDFFFNNCDGNLVKSLLEYCTDQFNHIGYVSKLFDVNAARIRYGLTYSAISNIVFTNGKLDPWSGGGIYENSPGIKHAKQNGVYTFLVDDSAHHLDLRQPNSCDPPSVVNLRYQVTNIITCWIKPSCTNLPKFTSLPNNQDWKQLNHSNCQSIIGGYPWGQHASSSNQLQLSVFPIILILIFQLLSY